MVSLSKLTPAKGSIKKRKRIARGEGAGSGDTATRGHNGAQSRSGYSRKFGFEGGQMPLQKRVPKFGFKNPNRVVYSIVNLDTLQRLSEEKKVAAFEPETFRKYGLTAKNRPVKILGKGELNAKIEVKAHAFSDSAKKSIEEKGGAAINL